MKNSHQKLCVCVCVCVCVCMCVCVYVCVCVCIYKMVVKITKETWGKCSIKTVKRHNEKENIIELWQKVSDLQTQIKHSNVFDIALKRIKKYYGKKTKKHHRRRKTKT